MALAGSIPSATPSKRSRLTPAGRRTVRVSLIRANPPKWSRLIDPEPRSGARYTVTVRSEGGEARTSAATAGAPAKIQARAIAAAESRDEKRLAPVVARYITLRYLVPRFAALRILTPSIAFRSWR